MPSHHTKLHVSLERGHDYATYTDRVASSVYTLKYSDEGPPEKEILEGENIQFNMQH